MGNWEEKFCASKHGEWIVGSHRKNNSFIRTSMTELMIDFLLCRPIVFILLIFDNKNISLVPILSKTEIGDITKFLCYLVTVHNVEVNTLMELVTSC